MLGRHLTLNAVAALFLVTLLGCGDSGGDPGDTKAPLVTDHYPQAEATDIPVTAALTVTFDEEMNWDTFSSQFRLQSNNDGSTVNGQFSFSGNTATFTPDPALMPGSSYFLVLSGGIEDLAGNSLGDELVWSFTTEQAKLTVSVTEPVADATDVLVSNAITVAFERPFEPYTADIHTVTLSDGFTSLPGNFSRGEYSFTFTPYIELLAHTVHTLTVDGVQGLQGEVMEAPFVLSFTTGAAADHEAPILVSMVPDVTNDVPIDVSIVATFSEPMQEAPLIGSYASCTALFRFTTIEDSATCIAGVASLNGSVLTFTPASPLEHSKIYNISILNGAPDLAGNGLVTAYGRSFTTIVAPSLAATMTTDEDVASIGFTPTQIGASGLSLTYTIDTQATHGTASVVSSQLVYTPDTNFNGADSFTFSGSDGAGLTLSGTATVAVAAINDAPSSATAEQTINEDSGATIVTPVVVDVDGDTVFITAIVNPPVNGTASASAGTLTYTPDDNFNGSDSFTFSVDDPTGASVQGTASFTVTPVNDAPVSGNQDLDTDEDVALQITLVATDIDGTTPTAAIAASPTKGTVECTNFACTYTPNANFNGTDYFLYRVFDGAAYAQSLGRIDITILPVPDAPVITGAPGLSATSGLAYLFRPTATDADGDSITWSIQNKPGWAAFSTVTGQLYGTPGDADAGSVSTDYTNIIITATGGAETSDVGPFTITVADGTPPGPVSAFVATSGNTEILLAWTNPADGDYAGVTILRSEGMCVTDPNDSSATQVFVGSAGDVTMLDQGLTNGVQYCYAAFSRDEVPNYGARAQRSALAQAGDLDTSWNSTGVGIIAVGAAGSTAPTESVYSLVVHGDTPYLGGRAYSVGADPALVVWKTDATTALSTTFGGDYTAPAGADGFYRYELDALPKSAQEIHVDSSGRVYMVATAGATESDAAVIRLTSAGLLDVGNFGPDADASGSADGYISLLGQGKATSLALNSAETKLYVLMDAYTGWTVAAFDLPAGTVDATFNGGTANASSADSARGSRVRVDSAGRVVVAGTVVPGVVANDADAAVWRLSAAGTLDTTFGGDYDSSGSPDGVVLYDGTDSAMDRSDQWVDMTVRSDNSIVVVGNSSWSGYNVLAVMAAYDSTGELDSTFATAGAAIWGSSGNSVNRFTDLHEDASGRLYVIASLDGTWASGVLVRFSSDGVSDNAFARVGASALGLNSLGYVATQSDGRVYVAGSKHNGTDWDIAVARLNP